MVKIILKNYIILFTKISKNLYILIKYYILIKITIIDKINTIYLYIVIIYV